MSSAEIFTQHAKRLTTQASTRWKTDHLSDYTEVLTDQDCISRKEIYLEIVYISKWKHDVILIKSASPRHF